MNCAETVGVRTFLNFECGCGPHCAVRTAHHTTVRVVLKPRIGGEVFQIFSIGAPCFYRKILKKPGDKGTFSQGPLSLMRSLCNLKYVLELNDNVLCM